MVSGQDDDSLAHFGVKGMRWGHRKKETSGSDEPAPASMPKKTSAASSSDVESFFDSFNPPTVGSNISVEDYMAVTFPPKNAAAEFRKNSEKFIAKTDPSGSVAPDAPQDGMTREQKQRMVKIAVGTLAVGAIVGYTAYQLNKPDVKFNLDVTSSKMNSWNGSGYVKPSSWDRPAFELPAGHTFHRISRAAEDGFNPATYATHNTEDFRRYVVGFRKELGYNVDLHHVTWKTTAPVKVPNLETTLDGLRTAMQKNGYAESSLTPERILGQYNSMSGGRWDSSLSKSFFQVLQERGFSAIVDEMDAGVIGETPLVLFGTQNMSPKNAAPLTPDAIRNAVELLENFPKPPRK